MYHAAARPWRRTVYYFYAEQHPCKTGAVRASTSTGLNRSKRKVEKFLQRWSFSPVFTLGVLGLVFFSSCVRVGFATLGVIQLLTRLFHVPGLASQLVSPSSFPQLASRHAPASSPCLVTTPGHAWQRHAAAYDCHC